MNTTEEVVEWEYLSIGKDEFLLLSIDRDHDSNSMSEMDSKLKEISSEKDSSIAYPIRSYHRWNVLSFVP